MNAQDKPDLQDLLNDETPILSDEVSDLRAKTRHDLQDALDKFEREFSEKGANRKGVPSITDIEELWNDLMAETKEIYSKHISDRLSAIDEKDIVKSKKENT